MTVPIEPPARSARRPVDGPALLRHRRRLQAAAAPPWLHGEVARRMAGRLPVIRRQPAVIADWWPRAGASASLLAAAYPSAERIEVEPDEPARAAAEDAAARPAAPWWSPRRWTGGRAGGAAAIVTEASLVDDRVDLLWANMVLHHAADPQAVMRRWQRALRVDGFLMFSTLGPGSLELLRRVYRERGWPPPHAPFVDMHDLGDMLVEAGFADPVMDQELLTLTFERPEALLAELRQLGGNADPGRASGLRTPRWRARLIDALAAHAGRGGGDGRDGRDGRIALGFEIVYGHAFRPPPRARVAGETTVPLQDLRAMVRAGREGRGSSER